MEPEERSARSGPGPLVWWVGGIGVILVLAVWAWKTMADKRHQDRLAALEASCDARVAAAVQADALELVRLAAEPLGLAVRQAALERNYGDMDAWFGRLARDSRIESIAYAGANDSIVAASDAGIEGRSLATVLEGVAPGAATRVERTAAGDYRAVVPITGLNERLGTLVVRVAGPDTTAAAPADTTG